MVKARVLPVNDRASAARAGCRARSALACIEAEPGRGGRRDRCQGTRRAACAVAARPGRARSFWQFRAYQSRAIRLNRIDWRRNPPAKVTGYFIRETRMGGGAYHHSLWICDRPARLRWPYALHAGTLADQARTGRSAAGPRRSPDLLLRGGERVGLAAGVRHPPAGDAQPSSSGSLEAAARGWPAGRYHGYRPAELPPAGARAAQHPSSVLIGDFPHARCRRWPTRLAGPGGAGSARGHPDRRSLDPAEDHPAFHRAGASSRGSRARGRELANRDRLEASCDDDVPRPPQSRSSEGLETIAKQAKGWRLIAVDRTDRPALQPLQELLCAAGGRMTQMSDIRYRISEVDFSLISEFLSACRYAFKGGA